MKYLSTRGQNDSLNFCDILLEGLAQDGGLYIPEHLPKFDRETLQSWRDFSYPELATEILKHFATDIPEGDLAKLCHAAYDPKVFNSASTKQMVPLKPLHDGLYLLGLSEGPTLAFKDMAMQFLGHLFEYVLAKRGAQINILGATSGDTGSAAEYALRGKKGVNVFMLSPYGRMSHFQRAQMYSLQDQNIFNLAIKGVFDDCQDIVKTLSSDLDFRQQYHLGAVNSINWARIAAQIVYYFWGWLRLNQDGPVSFTVPSGNFGNILAGHFARQMGLPIHRLVLATNENNVLEEFFNTGVYRPRSSEQTHATSSPSMDISKASNFERFVYDLLGHNPDKVKQLWQQLNERGYFDLSTEKERFEREFGFLAGQSNHADRLETIRTVWQQDHIMIDPHTADGVKVGRTFHEPGIPMLVLETALPIKFNDTIVEALQHPAVIPDHLLGLEQLPQRVDVLDNDARQVRDYIIKHLAS